MGFFLFSFAFLGLSILMINIFSTKEQKDNKRLKTAPVSTSRSWLRSSCTAKGWERYKDCFCVLPRSDPWAEDTVKGKTLRCRTADTVFYPRRGRATKNVLTHFFFLHYKVTLQWLPTRHRRVSSRNVSLNVLIHLAWNCVIIKPKINQNRENKPPKICKQMDVKRRNQLYVSLVA